MLLGEVSIPSIIGLVLAGALGLISGLGLAFAIVAARGKKKRDDPFRSRESGLVRERENTPLPDLSGAGRVVERCVGPGCGRETPYFLDTPVDQHRFYIESAGQFCEDCYRKIYGLNPD